MQMNIDIDDELMSKARRLSGLATNEAAIEEGLRMLICWSDKMSVADLRGVFPLDIDLEKSRLD